MRVAPQLGEYVILSIFSCAIQNFNKILVYNERDSIKELKFYNYDQYFIKEINYLQIHLTYFGCTTKLPHF